MFSFETSFQHTSWKRDWNPHKTQVMKGTMYINRFTHTPTKLREKFATIHGPVNIVDKNTREQCWLYVNPVPFGAESEALFVSLFTGCRSVLLPVFGVFSETFLYDILSWFLLLPRVWLPLKHRQKRRLVSFWHGCRARRRRERWVLQKALFRSCTPINRTLAASSQQPAAMVNVSHLLIRQ